ncbi:MAG: tetratricopeptide repeat protein, partial [Hyphomicrobiales bacterium]|nr:tetratricopeptide repeat protein [Hyphomicrobiales bacterium]
MPISIEQILLKAKRFAKKGENQLAAEQYKSVLEAFPNNQRAIQGLKALNQAPKGIQRTRLAGQRPAAPTRNQINSLLSLYNQGQFEKALVQGEELATQYPKALMVFNILGAINAALGELDQAVIAYTKAREIDPNVAEIHNNLGLALNGLKRHEEAVGSYQRAVKLKPDYAGAFNNLGLALNDLEKPKEAIDCYLKALKIRPEYAEAYNNIGIAQNNLHLHDKAVISYDKALEINADIAEVHKNKGQALSLMGRNEEALSCFTNVLRLNPDTIDAEILFSLSSLPPDLVNIDLVSLLDKVVLGPNSPDLNISMSFA